MRQDTITGQEFDQSRPKLKKDKNFFAKLDNREREENETTVKVEVKKIDVDLLAILPLGIQQIK